jgi:CBS domain-containing protein
MQTIRHLMRDKRVLAVESDTTVLEAARYMSRLVIGAVPVLSKGNILGMFTERDLMTRVVVPEREPSTTFVRQVMTEDVVTADPDDSRTECIAKMTARHCRHLPVVENGRLLGTISLRDLLIEDVEQHKEEVKLLTEYVQYVPPGHEGH